MSLIHSPSSREASEESSETSTTVPLLNNIVNSSTKQKLPNQDHNINNAWSESKKLWRIVGPSIFYRATNFSTITITQAFAGHLGSLELAAISLAYNVIIGFDFGLLLGMASALQTLCGQAFGAKKYDMLGIYLQRAWLILFLIAVVTLPMFLFAAPILKLIGEPAAAAELAGTVALWLVPLHFNLAFLFPLQRFLQSQLENAVLAWVSLAVLVVHVAMTFACVVWLGFGVTGSAVALGASWWVLFIGLIAYTVGGGCPATWTGLSVEAVEAFSGLWEFAKLSAASGVMICLEIWYYRILILITGSLSNEEIESHFTIYTLAIIFKSQFYKSLSSQGVRVSNELGAGNGEAAKYATKISIITSVGIGIFCWLMIMLFNDKIALLFSTSEPVLKVVKDLKLLLAFTVLLNSLQPVLSGVAVGSGWQSYVAFVNLGCYYLIGVPLGYLLGSTFGLGVKGIWLGMIFGGVGIQTVILAFMVGFCKWEKEVEKVSKRTQKSESNRNSVS